MKFTLTFLLFCILTSAAVAGPRKPNIVGQQTLVMNEDQTFTIEFGHLYVIDQDDFYPFGFSMEVHPGTNYTFDNLTVTPAKDFNGILTVVVSVNDGDSRSNKFDLKITVNPVNDPPVITAQATLSTNENTALAIKLGDLTVQDIDNSYPTGFSIQLQAGNNYTFSGTTVTPSAGYTGNLTVKLTVSDGASSSAVFGLKITVIPANKRPVITAQSSLTTAKNKSITISLNNLQVTDPDSQWPNDFSLLIYAGSNYTFSGTTITPATNFIGVLTVKVAVNDGHSTSEIYNLQIQVKDELVIIGQLDAEVNEDEKITLQISDLKVYDPDNNFPAGFSLVVIQGDHYTFTNAEVLPEINFNGILTISVKVTNGSKESPVYGFQLLVKPVNDPPELIDFTDQPVKYVIGGGQKQLYENLTISDPDDESLILAEISIGSGYQPGNDVLTYGGPTSIQAVFDNDHGILSLIGLASHDEYKLALESVNYEYINLENPVPQNKVVNLKMNDGKTVSILYEREIVAGENFEFDIPTAFSPNQDQANDTWRIKPHRPSERYNNTVVRILGERGVVVFESIGFEREWDGTFHGEPLPEGSYVYSVDLNLNYETQRLSGTVTILR